VVPGVLREDRAGSLQPLDGKAAFIKPYRLHAYFGKIGVRFATFSLRGNSRRELFIFSLGCSLFFTFFWDKLERQLLARVECNYNE
jgi:hypothetical protein